MADNNDEHITTTAGRYQRTDKQLQSTQGEKERPERTRVHRSIYLERNLYERLGEAHKIVGHELYPLDVRKSTFIEACIAYALDHLQDIKTALRKDL